MKKVLKTNSVHFDISLKLRQPNQIVDDFR